jgi:hypothetical protein
VMMEDFHDSSRRASSVEAEAWATGGGARPVGLGYPRGSDRRGRLLTQNQHPAPSTQQAE